MNTLSLPAVSVDVAPGLLNRNARMENAPPQCKPVITSGEPVEFRAILEGAAASPNICIISNRFPWQARLATEKLLDVAKGQKLPIRILSGRCHEGFYNEWFVSRLEACKAAGSPLIRVLVWQKSTDAISSDLMKLVDAGTIELRVSGTDRFEGQVPHFLLIGDRAFRQEAGHTPFTKHTVFTETEPQVPARIDFDDPATGRFLSHVFDTFWEGPPA